MKPLFSPSPIILNTIYKLAPFNIKADLKSNKALVSKDFISCLICAARPPEILKGLLADLSKQNLSQDRFEIIILNNGSPGLENLVEEFRGLLTIAYFSLPRSVMLGALRNKSIEYSQGEYVLFLDDDTRIPQGDFLSKALRIFKQSDPDMIMPLGKAILKDGEDRYQYLDPYSYATRCCFYKRSVLEKTGGFFDELAAYEDIDLGIRCNLMGLKVMRAEQLEYAHPSLLFGSLQKPLAIGQSVFKLQKHYPWYIWGLIYLNALRFLPMGLVATKKNRQWFKISWGVLIAPFVHREYTYQ